MRIRKSVMDFALEMEKKLRKNDHKTGWRRCTYGYLLEGLHEETQELMKEMRAGNVDSHYKNITPKIKDNIISECADIANYAMMISDNVKNKE